jgi:hypothetical protein
MNTSVHDFFRAHYAPGRVCLIGSTNPVHQLIREAQQSITTDGQASKYNHTFLMSEQRNDGRDDGSIYIFESDLHASMHDLELKNGIMESRITKWCLDDLEYAAVLGLDLTPSEIDALVSKALWYAYDEEHLRYPIGGLFGTLGAIITHRLELQNVFNHTYAVQCASFIRLCFQSIGRDLITTGTHPSNTSPEEISQSSVFTFRKEWSK